MREYASEFIHNADVEEIADMLYYDLSNYDIEKLALALQEFLPKHECKCKDKCNNGCEDISEQEEAQIVDWLLRKI